MYACVIHSSLYTTAVVEKATITDKQDKKKQWTNLTNLIIFAL